MKIPRAVIEQARYLLEDPFFDGNRIDKGEARLRDAKARLDQAAKNYEDVKKSNDIMLASAREVEAWLKEVDPKPETNESEG